MKFTFPVIISRRLASGKCVGAIGAFVVLNDEGWIATCFHISDMITKGLESADSSQKLEAEKNRINSDIALSNTQKRKQVDALPTPKKTDVDRISVIWGVQLAVSTQINQFYIAPPIDLAIGKLEPFDPSWVAEYPKLKDPAKDFLPGASLCRVGYPFHDITPTWDSGLNGFQLPQRAIPIPSFAIDGILTRLVNVEVPKNPDPLPFPMKLFETSSPGLQGQSGGAVFDRDGVLWGLQTATASYPLGFEPTVPHSNPAQKVHQFLNVGRCIHAESIIGLLGQHGIKYDLSAS